MKVRLSKISMGLETMKISLAAIRMSNLDKLGTEEV